MKFKTLKPGVQIRILSDTSQGIEPLYAETYQRRYIQRHPCGPDCAICPLLEKIQADYANRED